MLSGTLQGSLKAIMIQDHSIQVSELDWGNEAHIKAVDPPFDYIIGTDVVYAEHLLEPLLQTLFALSGPKTTILLGYEIRNLIVHEQMLSMWKNNFEVKTVPKAKMDSKYQHESIQLYILDSKSRAGCARNEVEASDQQTNEIETTDKDGDKEDIDNLDEADEMGDCESKKIDKDGKPVAGINDGKLTDWEVRRYGSMAARLLQDVKIS